MRVGVDLDGVVYPFETVFAHWVNKVTGRPLSQLQHSKKWHFYEDWGYTRQEFLLLYKWGVEAEFILRRGHMIPGSWAGINDLHKLGHSVHIVTDRWYPKAHANTEAWLSECRVKYDSLTYCEDKWIVRLDAAIDDKPDNVTLFRAVGTKAFLLDNGLNEQADFRPAWVVNSWPDFVEKVKELG